MSIANLLSRIFNHVIIPLSICKYNLQVAMDKEDCGLVAVMRHPNKLRVAHIYTIVDKKLS